MSRKKKKWVGFFFTGFITTFFIHFFTSLTELCSWNDPTNSYNNTHISRPPLDFCLLNSNDTPLFSCYLLFLLCCFLQSGSDPTIHNHSLLCRYHTFCSTNVALYPHIYSIDMFGRCLQVLVFYTEHALLCCKSSGILLPNEDGATNGAVATYEAPGILRTIYTIFGSSSCKPYALEVFFQFFKIEMVYTNIY